ncbi:GAF domain-containing protein [Balamuthia mandrillaris]
MEQAEAQQEQGAKERLRHAEFYRDLYREAESLVSGEDDLIANTANIASLVYHALNERQSNTTNWVGFYFVRSSETKGEELVLGPFQGKVACIRIAKGKGVCGMCWNTKQGIVVPDVHKFEGHIACDSASESEIVLPIIDPSTGEVKGVFDIDSPHKNTFTEEDRDGLQPFADLIAKACRWF